MGKLKHLTIEFTGRWRTSFKHRQMKLVQKHAVPRPGAMSGSVRPEKAKGAIIAPLCLLQVRSSQKIQATSDVYWLRDSEPVLILDIDTEAKTVRFDTRDLKGSGHPLHSITDYCLSLMQRYFTGIANRPNCIILILHSSKLSPLIRYQHRNHNISGAEAAPRLDQRNANQAC
jgi:hypothetical protein